MTTPHRWTPKEIRLLRRWYPDHLAAEIAARLGIGLHQVYYMAEKLRLKKSAAFLASPKSGRLMRGTQVNLASRFHPGHTAWNKGRKGANPGSEAGWFKKGNLPHTWKPIGSERVPDGYLQRKVTDTGNTRRDWVPVHHLVWREAGRAIPPGHALVFRDGDRRNFDLDNLELISRHELMRRNTLHRFGKELVQLIRLRGALSRQIHQRNQRLSPSPRKE
jgi:hypothetical protein